MPGNVVRPTSELTLMMRPDPRARIAGSTARVMASSPNTFVSNWRRTSGPVGHRAARPPETDRFALSRYTDLFPDATARPKLGG